MRSRFRFHVFGFSVAVFRFACFAVLTPEIAHFEQDSLCKRKQAFF